MAASYPKPDGERRNRHAPAFGWKVLPAEGRKGPTPPLPDWRKWSESTLTWWQALWATPQASQWLTDDPELPRLALMHETVWSSSRPSAALLTEMRQIEDRHGLSPKAMLQLRWIVAEPAPSEAPKPKPKTNPRKDRVLRMIDGG